ncbi:hypothetical protein J2S00_001017 [Caldalkalibacillus uzonensis]|uniref:DUF1850 domain-containing protein n=1 Tax=Caldalkalibacillus uzonensis TaxID=353224 RepID=A0ABU0CP89_9BACI|nr:DUF1850 domain-containing protein [Caldalkalibacillus uzonensis]MDQ0338233.1 hypothetical protein [Caldalkalibacillus uzonensis]
MLRYASSPVMNKYVLIAVLCLVAGSLSALTFVLASPAGQYDLVIHNEKNGTVYVQQAVSEGDMLELSWIHSVEKTPWHEILQVESGHFVLVETRFQSFGAGVPHTKEGTVKVEDDYVIMTELSEVIPVYRWIHSHHVQFGLELNGEPLLQTGDIPHHQPVEMRLKKRW